MDGGMGGLLDGGMWVEGIERSVDGWIEKWVEG